MSKATIQYRGTEVEVKPGHHAVLDCYKKKMLGQVVVKVEEYEGGGVVPDGEVAISSNGIKNVAGYATANVNVQPKLEDKTADPSEQKQTLIAAEGYDGIKSVVINAIQTQEKTAIGNGTVEADTGKYLKRVHVEVPAGAGASGTRDITENGTYNVKEYANAAVNVQPPLEEKTVAAAEVVQTIEPGENAYGLSKVKVGAIPLETKMITENGVHQATSGKYFKTVTVDVPIPDGYLQPVGDFPITKNGEYAVSKYETATVNVQPVLGTAVITPGETQIIRTPGVNIEGFYKVTVNAIKTETCNVTQPEGEISPTSGYYFKKVVVDIPFVKVHSGTSEPTSDIGVNGDIYLLMEE